MRNRVVWMFFVSVLLLPIHSVSQTSNTNTTAVLLGDSEMLGFLNFPEFLPKDTINLAVGGSSTADTARAVSKAVSYNPKSIFILTGTADFLRQDIDPILKNYDDTLRSIQSLSPGTTVYVQALFPQDADSQPTINGINDALRKRVSTHSNTVFLDFTPSFSNPGGGLKSELNQDGVHLNRSGYQLWGQLLAPYF